ncbi:Uncharacterized protein Rs2_39041 [Raphanus sativus]|nr:Uncharacterized protein Rs2_39041 [Raphanus sativus]
MDVMLIFSCCTILDESPFVEKEVNHEIYREINGDPIYDVYEDDVDFIFKEGSFENLGRANFGRDEVCAKSVQDEFRAKLGRNHSCKNRAKHAIEDSRNNFYWEEFWIQRRFESSPTRRE